MRELAMHVHDLVLNATAAGAATVRIAVQDSLARNMFGFTVEDDGCGMSAERLSQAVDTSFTTRATRRVGLGLPLAKMNAEQCGGGLRADSEEGKGTRLECWFQHRHWDRPPMGDLPGTVALLMAQYGAIRFLFTYATDQGIFSLDSAELKETLYRLPLNRQPVVCHLKAFITQHLSAIAANLD